jgi:hypothetical protein
LKASRIIATSGLGGAGLRIPTLATAAGCCASATTSGARSPSRRATRRPTVLEFILILAVFTVN